MPRPVAYRSSRRMRAKLGSGSATKARAARTYRADRRNRAKLARRANDLRGTVGAVMEPAPQGLNGTASVIPRRVYHRVGKKLYQGGNVPGGRRRAEARTPVLAGAR